MHESGRYRYLLYIHFLQYVGLRTVGVECPPSCHSHDSENIIFSKNIDQKQRIRILYFMLPTCVSFDRPQQGFSVLTFLHIHLHIKLLGDRFEPRSCRQCKTTHCPQFSFTSPQISFAPPQLSFPSPKLIYASPQLSLPHPNLATPHPNLATPHPNLATPHPNLIMPHPNLVTPHPNLL
jgi:hypothetical protein